MPPSPTPAAFARTGWATWPLPAWLDTLLGAAGTGALALAWASFGPFPGLFALMACAAAWLLFGFWRMALAGKLWLLALAAAAFAGWGHVASLGPALLAWLTGFAALAATLHRFGKPAA